MPEVIAEGVSLLGVTTLIWILSAYWSCRYPVLIEKPTIILFEIFCVFSAIIVES